jgi:hypothetical protein
VSAERIGRPEGAWATTVLPFERVLLDAPDETRVIFGAPEVDSRERGRDATRVEESEGA